MENLNTPIKMQSPPQHTPVLAYDWDVTRLLYMLYTDIEAQLARADQKAQLILSTNAILAVIFAGLGLDFAVTQPESLNPPQLAAIAAYVLSYGALVISIYYALSSAFPRSRHRNAAQQDHHFNLYYSAHIARLQPADYQTRFLNMSIHDMLNTVLMQVHAKSSILEAKYGNIRRSMVFVMVGIASWVSVQILQTFFI